MNIQCGVFERIKKIAGVFSGCVLKQLCGLFLVGLSLAAGEASAYVMRYSDLSNGYSNCSLKDNGNGTSTARVDFDYKAAAGHHPTANFQSRGVIVYTYGAAGQLNESSSVGINSVTLGGFEKETIFGGYRYAMFANRYSSQWINRSPFRAAVVVQFNNSIIAKWPAIGIRAGIFTSGDDYGDSAGLAYISPATQNGICTLLVNPEQPPPPMDVTLTMNAPDWDIGELSRGEETLKTLSAANDQLCFTYEGSKFVTFQKYIINATNLNGLSSNGRYLLKSLEDSSKTVPYSLTLQNDNATMLLPNAKNTGFNLNENGRTCFTPTFTALAEKKSPGGAYSDVLTFTVVAKP